MNIFPFTVYNAQTTQWFRSWFQENRNLLDEEYGSYYYTGNPERDSKTRFGYYEADVELISSSEIIVSFYDMASTVYGGRGELICVVPGVPEIQIAHQLIEQQIQELTIEEYDRREAERLKKQREDGIVALRQELFGKLKY